MEGDNMYLLIYFMMELDYKRLQYVFIDIFQDGVDYERLQYVFIDIFRDRVNYGRLKFFSSTFLYLSTRMELTMKDISESKT